VQFSSDQHRILMPGLAVQPLIAGAVGFLLFPTSEIAIVMGVLFAITGAVIAGCVAYPILIRVVRRRRLTLLLTLTSGALFGNIPAALATVAIIASGTADASELATLIRPMSVGTLTGLCAAAGFWALSGRHIEEIRHGEGGGNGSPRRRGDTEGHASNALRADGSRDAAITSHTFQNGLRLWRPSIHQPPEGRRYRRGLLGLFCQNESSASLRLRG
jgi:hypothetical protein